MIANLALGCFVVTGALAVLRVMRGPSLADRVVALDDFDVEKAAHVRILFASACPDAAPFRLLPRRPATALP